MAGGQESQTYRDDVLEWWDSWTAQITAERASDRGRDRLRGFLKQLVTETVVYLAIALAFAGGLLAVDMLTALVIYGNPLVTLPNVVGAVMGLLFTISHDTWVRTEDQSD